MLLSPVHVVACLCVGEWVRYIIEGSVFVFIPHHLPAPFRTRTLIRKKWKILPFSVISVFYSLAAKASLSFCPSFFLQFTNHTSLPTGFISKVYFVFSWSLFRHRISCWGKLDFQKGEKRKKERSCCWVIPHSWDLKRYFNLEHKTDKKLDF